MLRSRPSAKSAGCTTFARRREGGSLGGGLRGHHSVLLVVVLISGVGSRTASTSGGPVDARGLLLLGP